MIRRLAGALVGTAWRASPAACATAFAATTVAAIASALFPLGYHAMVDGALAHDATRVAGGAIVVSALFTLAWALGTMAAGRNSVLIDRINAFLAARIAHLVNALPDLEHFERPESLREIDQLRDGRRTLAAAVSRLLAGWQVVIRGAAIMVLLATVYPPVMIVPLVGLLPGLADRRAARIQRRTDDELAADRRLIGELFTLATSAESAKELRTYGITEALAARHAALSEHVRARAVQGALRGALWEAAGWIGYAAAFVAVIVVLVLRAAHGHASAGQVVMAISLMRRAQAQVAGASGTLGSLSAAVRTARRLIWLEDQVAERTGRVSEGRPPARLRTGIRLEGVEFRYPGADEPVLRGVDLELPAGRTVAVVGENGAGKTTLVKLLTGMYRPTAGRVLVDGADLADLAPDRWRSRTTAVFQDFQRFNLLARETVGVGDLPRMDDDAAVGSAVSRSGAGPLVAGLPQGLRTPLGRWFTGGHDLSGGQWQRLALARGLMRHEPLLTVLDEPTASLDPAAEARLFARFTAMARAARESGGSTLLISHRFSTVRTADLIVVLADGRVAETGGHEELLARDGIYARLFGLQNRAYLDRPAAR